MSGQGILRTFLDKTKRIVLERPGSAEAICGVEECAVCVSAG